jgi:hypothetical protein
MRLVLCHSGLTGCDTVLSGIVLFTGDVVHPEVFLKYSATSVHELNPFLEAVRETKCS